MSDALYEIAEEMNSLLDIIAEATDPNPRCKYCIDQWMQDSDGRWLHLVDPEQEGYLPCPSCDDVGSVEPMDNPDMDEALTEALKDIEGSFAIKCHGILQVMANWDGWADMIREEEKKLAARRQSLVRRKDRLRGYLARHMNRVGLKKVETPLKNISLIAGSKSVVIDDEMKLPQGTFDTEMIIKPDKKTIKGLLAKDIDVPGAHIATGEPTVRIK